MSHHILEALRDLDLERRQVMIRTQLAARGIRDRNVLVAMEQVPRHLFVPEDLRSEAYSDRPLPIGFGQTISQPHLVALALQALELEGNERVLEVGCGSGYQAALLGVLAREVYSLEIVADLERKASDVLRALMLDNVHVIHGDGAFGHESAAPYDAIVVATSVPEVPSALIDQLRPGGRLVIPLGDESGQLLMRLRKHDCSVESETLAACSFVPMTGALQGPAEVPWAESPRRSL